MDQLVKGFVYRPKYITRQFVKLHPNDIFVFGDNMARRGFKGQAKEMRGEPNAIGIPTKWLPSNLSHAFFSEKDWLKTSVLEAICGSFVIIESKLLQGKNVYIPYYGLGTGFAQLQIKAPTIANFIDKAVEDLAGRFAPPS
jgi:hypothetical protein